MTTRSLPSTTYERNERFQKRRISHNRISYVYGHRRLFLRARRETTDGPKHLIVSFMACFEYPSRLCRSVYEKQRVYHVTMSYIRSRTETSRQFAKKKKTGYNAGCNGRNRNFLSNVFGRNRAIPAVVVSLMRRDSERQRERKKIIRPSRFRYAYIRIHNREN